MKYGVNTFIWSEEFNRESLKLLPRIKEAGFDGVQVPLFRPADFPAAEVRRGFEANGLECSVCGLFPDGQTLIGDDAAERRVALQHIKDTVRVAAETGADFVGGPLYCPIGYLPGRRRTADEWKRAVEGYQSVGETLISYGITLAIEPINRFETFFLNTAADSAALCDEVAHPNVGILFDTFHANIEEKDIGAAFRTLGRHLRHVHACENDRGIPGSGHFEWDQMFLALRDLNYDGWLTIESFGFTGKISTAVCIWRDIESNPESIAFEGVKFLKSRVAAMESAPALRA
ncbi:MAG: sugar phosphate isomerase/epimerase family protein [Terriglobia bacterium]